MTTPFVGATSLAALPRGPVEGVLLQISGHMRDRLPRLPRCCRALKTGRMGHFCPNPTSQRTAIDRVALPYSASMLMGQLLEIVTAKRTARALSSRETCLMVNLGNERTSFAAAWLQFGRYLPAQPSSSHCLLFVHPRPLDNACAWHVSYLLPLRQSNSYATAHLSYCISQASRSLHFAIRDDRHDVENDHRRHSGTKTCN